MNVKDILRTNHLEVSQDDTIVSVIGKLSKGHTEAVVVDAKGKYVGMLWKRKLIRSRITPEEKVKNFLLKSASLTYTSTIEDAAKKLHSADCHVLPVVENGKVLGICGARDVLQALQTKLAGCTAIDCGSMSLTVLKEDDAIAKAVTLFHDEHIHRIPVVDKNGKMVGIVSLIDLLVRYASGSARGAVSGRQGKHGRTSHSGIDAGDKPSFPQLPVSNIMTKLVATCSPNAKASDVIKLLNDQGISSVILVQNDLPVGIVTTKDLLREVCA
ncbi:CBS domain-containing protein [Candidatus Woesearchaeota archaeon]|nr:CBS domain-containing protein [Candidatus Woesearchaeota archaeon]